MNGRVYDPLLARFGTADPMTESPFSTQGWNRYSYVGNSPLNFTDPSGYCFMGCFWKPIFKAIGNFFRENWRSLVQIAAAAICTPMGLGPVCAVAATTIITGITSGNLGLALRAGFIAAVTAGAFYAVGSLAPSGVLNIAGHAAVGCLSAVASGGKCGPGALAAGVSAAGAPLIGKAFPNARTDMGHLLGGTAASAILGGLGSVAGGGKFANGAVTGAFGYLFNKVAHCEYGPCFREPLGQHLSAPMVFHGGFSLAGIAAWWWGTQVNSTVDGSAVDRLFSENQPSLVDDKGAQHILDSDETGGGHRAGTGIPGKTEFPADWSDDKILGEISDVATDPSSKHEVQGSRTVSEGTRDGVEIRTVHDGGRIITGYPTNLPRNPK